MGLLSSEFAEFFTLIAAATVPKACCFFCTRINSSTPWTASKSCGLCAGGNSNSLRDGTPASFPSPCRLHSRHRNLVQCRAGHTPLPSCLTPSKASRHPKKAILMPLHTGDSQLNHTYIAYWSQSVVLNAISFFLSRAACSAGPDGI